MKNVWKIVKEHYVLLAYSVLTIFLLCACFVPAFAWIAAVMAVSMTVLLRKETQLVGLLLYLNSFYALFNYQTLFGITLDLLVSGSVILMLCGHYIYHVIKREQKLNWKTLVPIGLFMVYMVLPFHECNFADFFGILFFLTLLYVVFERRQQIDFRYIVYVFVSGIIFSCSMALLRDVSPLLTEILEVVTCSGGVRFEGFCFHPNILAGILMVAICAILILKYKNKISIYEFLVAFVPMFIFGYLTISRNFLFTALAGIVIFAVLYLVQRKVKAMPLLGIMFVVMALVCLAFFGITKTYIDRIETDNNFLMSQIVDTNVNDLDIANLSESFDNQPEAWKQAVLAGKKYFDPGRAGLYEIYLRDWSSSPQTILFGRGASRPLIGKMSAHNLLIQELWKHGLVGYCFYLAMIIGSINWKKIKSIKKYLPGLIILVPYLMTTMIEQCLYDYAKLIVIIVAITFSGQVLDSDVDVKPLIDEEKLDTNK